ncbi:MAG: tetratricopeptide repeat protein, partial [Planctomycetota bacterium]
MRKHAMWVGLLAVLLLGAVAAAEQGPEESAKEARRLYDRGRYGQALEIWTTVLGKHRRHELVTDGTAHWHASKCLRQLGEHAEAASLLEGYLKAHPKGKGVFGALAGIFHSWADAGDEKKAMKAGGRVFKSFPNAVGTYWVLRKYLERGWKVPKLATDFDVLYRWTFDRTSGSQYPELRLAMLDLLAALHKGSKFVKGGGILYCRAWCYLKTERYEEAVALGEKHLKQFPRASERDKVRMVVAEALLEMDPPKVERAKKVLEALIRNPGRYKEQAEKLLAAAKTGGRSIQITEGFPRLEGQGRVVVLTDLPSTSARMKALDAWRKARTAEVVRFRPRGQPSEAARELARLGPEYVAVVVAPETLDGNFHLSMLELCRGLDEDPMPDFSFGYLVARDAKDLGDLATRILAKEREGGRAARLVGTPSSGAAIEGLDFFIHFGHGTPRRIVRGMTASQIAALTLPRRPVVFSGACFNGVCSRSFDRSILELSYKPPEDIDPKETVSLSWIHAGATGLIAALDGDRGEMALAEWEHFRASAAPLGDVVGYQYRLVFASLPETYSGFPRYLPGHAKRTGFHDVMLRGMTSRILISDPSYRPLAEPLDSPFLATTAEVDAAKGALRVRIEVKRPVSGPFIN